MRFLFDIFVRYDRFKDRYQRAHPSEQDNLSLSGALVEAAISS